jgi:hypothetical protein
LIGAARSDEERAARRAAATLARALEDAKDRSGRLMNAFEQMAADLVEALDGARALLALYIEDADGDPREAEERLASALQAAEEAAIRLVEALDAADVAATWLMQTLGEVSIETSRHRRTKRIAPTS